MADRTTSLKILATVEQITYLLYLHVTVNLCLPFIHLSAFSTYEVIGLLVDKILYKQGVFIFSAHHEFTASHFTEANKYHAILNTYVVAIRYHCLGKPHCSCFFQGTNCIAHNN